MDRESWENLQFLLVYKIHFNATDNTPAHKLYQMYKQWIKFETELKKQMDEEAKKLRAELRSKRGR